MAGHTVLLAGLLLAGLVGVIAVSAYPDLLSRIFVVGEDPPPEPQCPTGYVFVNGLCKPDNDEPGPGPTPMCPTGYHLSNGVCVIDQPQGDTTAPTVTITAPVGGTALAAGTTSVTVSGTASDNIGVLKVEVSVNGGAYTAVSGTTSWTGGINNLQNGQSYIVKVRSVDTSNNLSSVKTITFTVAASQCPSGQHLVNGQCVPDSVNTGPKDVNGMLYPQPFLSEGIKLNYFNEAFGKFDQATNPSGWHANFRTDGHRYDFDGERDSVMVAGYFFIPNNFSQDEISAKMNGGPHSGSCSNSAPSYYADVFDLGITNFSGDISRLRFEASHACYSSGIPPTYEELPIGSVKGKWVGAVGMKVNLDMDKNGSFDHVGVVGMIDVGGLDSAGKPVNNWKITYKRIFTEAEVKAVDAGGYHIKSVYKPFVCTIGQCDLAQNTIRIDNSPPTGLLDKFVTAKTINAVPAS